MSTISTHKCSGQWNTSAQDKNSLNIEQLCNRKSGPSHCIEYLVYAVSRNSTLCPSSSATVVELTAPSGLITSPNYPGNYYNNAAYGWRVIAQSADMVSIYCVRPIELMNLHPRHHQSLSCFQNIVSLLSNEITVADQWHTRNKLSKPYISKYVDFCQQH